MANEKKNAKTNTTELQAAIQSLIAKGKKEGMIRAADLQAHLDKLDLSPETIEKIYGATKESLPDPNTGEERVFPTMQDAVDAAKDAH